MMTRQEIVSIFEDNTVAKEIMGYRVIHACLDEWERPHRFYHGLSHLSELLEGMKNYDGQDRREKMEILALFHDVIYDPRKTDNEDKSIEFVRKIVDNNCDGLEEIFEGIRYTKYDKPFKGAKDFIESFCYLDIGYNKQPSEIAKKEIKLLKEFQYIDYPKYKSERIKFIKEFQFDSYNSDLSLDFVTNYRPKIGVYPGSFNPFHIGHMNILEQAEKIFDKVIIAVGKNPEKVEDGKPWPGKVLPFHEVVSYHTLLSEYLKTLDYADVTIIRGLRSGYDLEYEMNQLRILEDYGCKLPVIYFICSKETSHVSSSMIRGLNSFPNSQAEKYIPKKYDYAKV